MDKRFTHGAAKAFLALLLSVTWATAQKEYGNEWIDTTQMYLRVPVVQTGFYKITAAELRNAGFPIDLVKASALQLFRRGEEIAMEVNNDGEKPGIASYILFYGEKNDGARDSSLYVTPKAMPHAYYSLYSDTASYFLTCRKNGPAGKRITGHASTITKELVSYHLNEILQIQTTEYPAGNLYPMGSNYDTGTALTTYDVGEGWTGKALTNQSETLSLETEGILPGPLKPIEAELLIVGRSAGNHLAASQSGEPNEAGSKSDTIRLLNYNTVRFRTSFFTADGNAAVRITPVGNTGLVSVSYIKWRYPQQTTLPSNALQKTFCFDTTFQGKTLVVKNAGHWQFYDCSVPGAVKKLMLRDTLLPLNGATRVIAFREPFSILQTRLVRFKAFKPAYDYLIISHPLVRTPTGSSKDPVQDYAGYRASQEGGNFTPVLLNRQEIDDQFNFGDPGPLGIRNAISFLHKHAALRFVLLLGKSIDPQTARHQLQARQNDMVPNAGWPGSDMALTMGLEGSSAYVPLVPIGRVNAANAQHVFDYLQKVKTYESQPAATAWRKNILHLSGGQTVNEREIFRLYMESFEKKIFPSSLGAEVQTISKKTDEPVELFPISPIINRGVALITLYGHSGLHSTDIDIGIPDDAKLKYNNTPYFPAVLANGCAMGNVYYSKPAISNDWILSPNKGAVLFLAHTHNGVTSSLKHYTDSFYDVLADSLFVSKPFGSIQQEAIRRNMEKYPTLSDGITAQQMNLLGDPAIRVFPATLPDYTWERQSIKFSDPSGKTLTTKSDSIQVKTGIRNTGRFRKENYSIRIQRKTNAHPVLNYTVVRSAAANLDTLSITLPNTGLKPGTEKWKFSIDPDRVLTEEDEENNDWEMELVLPGNNDLEPAQISGAGVSPNPSNQQFRFFMTIAGLVLPEKWTVSIFDIRGRNVYRKELKAHLGQNEHVWESGNAAAGIYIYRITPDKKFTTSSPEVQKGLQGKLIRVP